jgi:hypothetical protein
MRKTNQDAGSRIKHGVGTDCSAGKWIHNRVQVRRHTNKWRPMYVKIKLRYQLTTLFPSHGKGQQQLRKHNTI